MRPCRVIVFVAMSLGIVCATGSIAQTFDDAPEIKIRVFYWSTYPTDGNNTGCCHLYNSRRKKLGVITCTDGTNWGGHGLNRIWHDSTGVKFYFDSYYKCKKTKQLIRGVLPRKQEAGGSTEIRIVLDTDTEKVKSVTKH